MASVGAAGTEGRPNVARAMIRYKRTDGALRGPSGLAAQAEAAIDAAIPSRSASCDPGACLKLTCRSSSRERGAVRRCIVGMCRGEGIRSIRSSTRLKYSRRGRVARSAWTSNETMPQAFARGFASTTSTSRPALPGRHRDRRDGRQHRQYSHVAQSPDFTELTIDLEVYD